MNKVVEFLNANPVQYLATVGRDGKILHRVGIQKFYDFVHDEYLQNGI